MGEALLVRKAGGGGAKVTINGVEYKGELSLTKTTTNKSESTLPRIFYLGSAVATSSGIYMIGGYTGYVGWAQHYKWNGSSWSAITNSPVGFGYDQAVVLNGEIHVLDGDANSSGNCVHYKWNGGWASVSSLPYTFTFGSAVVLNNEIHILGGTTFYTYHYKWNGSSWTSVSTLPYNFYQSSAVVWNGRIHILGSVQEDYRTKHYILSVDYIYTYV